MLCIIIIHSYTWHVHFALILEEIHLGFFLYILWTAISDFMKSYIICAVIYIWYHQALTIRVVLAIRNDETDMLKGNLLFLWEKKYMKYEAV